ncbi:enediyne biosynthesis protein UnbU [Streptosporangium sp. NBC_01639]|uniref:enediyne biosynthesis protein UnbU n=1 Tax=Streptosporangium sp. NBC_01639 TaxID=2975948 RepID=UPI00386A81BC|nr:enediyne biosynthesis protein UnbU [Streptosporangium sp. NBC_01639]
MDDAMDDAMESHDRALRRFAGSITFVTVLGHTVLDFEQPYLAPVVGAATGVATAFVLETVEAWAWRRPPGYRRARCRQAAGFFLPSYVTGLTCAMLLYTGTRPMPVALAVLIGVGSTYVLRVRVPGTARRRGGGALRAARPSGGAASAGTRPRDRFAAEGQPGEHYLNPSCLGVTAVLLLFPWAGVAPPYPLGGLVPPAVLLLGSVVNARLAGRLPLVLSWAGGFALLELVRGGPAGALPPMTGMAFVLYTNYLVTDPGSTPARSRGQVVFGLATAAVYGLLAQFAVVFGLFFALLIVCVGRGTGLALLARVRPSTAPVPADARDLSGVPAGVQP